MSTLRGGITNSLRPSVKYAQYLQQESQKATSQGIKDSIEHQLEELQAADTWLIYYDRFIMGLPLRMEGLNKKTADAIMYIMNHPNRMQNNIKNFAHNNGLLKERNIA